MTNTVEKVQDTYNKAIMADTELADRMVPRAIKKMHRLASKKVSSARLCDLVPWHYRWTKSREFWYILNNRISGLGFHVGIGFTDLDARVVWGPFYD